MISIWVTKGQGHCISFLSCIYTGKCLTRPQYTGLAMVSKVDAGGLYKYCHLLISPVTCRTQSTNTLLEVIMLKIYCCDRKDFQEQGLAVIELVYEYRMGRSIGPH